MNLIPTFPNFRYLTDSDKSVIDSYQNEVPCYSDFNFVSLYDYNTKDQTKIATLYGNLVVISLDYLTGKPFLSFIGHHKVKHTLPLLFEYAAKSNITPTLRLIPEHSITHIFTELEKDYIVTEDPDNHDYILATEEVMRTKGELYRSKRRQIQEFNNTHVSHTLQFLSSSDNLPSKRILDVFHTWELEQHKDTKDTEVELRAIQRILSLHKKVDFHFVGLYIKEQLIGFSFCEVLPDHYGMIHFQKTDYKYHGSFTYLTQQTATHLWNFDCQYINIQQDLGIEGMKISKQLWHPVKMLKKYSIKLKSRQ